MLTLTRKVRTLFDARTSLHGLTYARARILLHLYTCEPPTQAELAEAMEVERPTMARLIDSMEEGGLVRREVSSEDRRQRHVHLCDPAKTQAKAVIAMTDAMREDIMKDISAEDLATAHRVIQQMLDNVTKAS